MRTALITGATSGIGYAIAERFAHKGIRLILCGRRVDKLEALKSEFQKLTEVFTLSFDIRHSGEVKAALDSLPSNFNQVDILVNNAGNAHGLDPIDAGNIEDWDAMMDGNVKGLLYVSRFILPKMKELKSGHVINISSVAALQTYPNGTVYCASKRAVDAISEGMRLELTEFGIKVTNVRPGAVETEFSQVRFKGNIERAATVYSGYQPLKAEDIADAIDYITSAPAHVTIADLTIYPSAQASPSLIFKNN